MTYSEIEKSNLKIGALIQDHRLNEALLLLEELTEECRQTDFRNRLAAYRETYRNILKYSFEQGDDPEKENVYSNLVKYILDLRDEVKEALVQQGNMISYYPMKLSVTNEYGGKLDELSAWVERMTIRAETNEDHIEASDPLPEDFFNYFWLNDKLREKEFRIIQKIIHNNAFPWYYKSLIVSALTLSLLRVFDSSKVILLFEFYNFGESKIWQRALTGIVLNLYIHDDRISYYPEILDQITLLEGNHQWNKSVESIIIQFLRAKDTDKVTEKIKKDILPEIWKIKSTLEDKLNMEDLLKDKMIEDKNPEWERVFEDTPDVYKKLEEFSTLQMEGADVFMSAFSMLKGFDFFNRIDHWFLPFYKENNFFDEDFKSAGENFNRDEFMEGLESSGFLCNSDKYSFCLNVRHMPSGQKTMMLELFRMELQAMQEMSSDDELLRKDVKDRAVIVQYIQDLYRFFKLYPKSREFRDVFERKFDFINTRNFSKILGENEILRNIGEFYFENDHYKEALDVFISLENIDQGNELLEKIAYCYQCLGDFKNALEYYYKAEMVSKPGIWLYNKIAFCNRRLSQFDEALRFYRKSEKLDPENLFVQTSLGQTHMERDEFEEALKYFFKVEYLAPDNIKIHRPLGWCSFVVGKLENAEKYLEKVIEKDPGKFDYMNLGHVYWSLGKKKQAIQRYKTAYEKAEKDHEWFVATLKEDAPFLINAGIPEFDIPLMVDFIRISVHGE